VSAGTLTWIHEVRKRLEAPPPRRLPPDDVRPAAVLVPLFIEQGRLLTLLTRRSDDLPHHRGQIAFPGGGLELGEDAWAAALRESYEELALDPGRILKLGQLDEVVSPVGFRIVPCVGAVPVPLEIAANESEIEEVFSVPLLALAEPGASEERDVELDGHRRSLRIYRYGDRQIWGLTARIVQNLLERLGL
jgi:8-oxo-dGTP pyrophosphatase MutT (NUDIX family)